MRNEYSKRCLQEDFKSGLRELYRKDDDEEGGTNEEANTAIPGEFALDVFCISANDYLKVMNIKPRRDGPPNTFASATQTEIPQLRSYVHSCTSRFRCVGILAMLVLTIIAFSRHHFLNAANHLSRRLLNILTMCLTVLS